MSPPFAGHQPSSAAPHLSSSSSSSPPFQLPVPLHLQAQTQAQTQVQTQAPTPSRHPLPPLPDLGTAPRAPAPPARTLPLLSAPHHAYARLPPLPKPTSSAPSSATAAPPQPIPALHHPALEVRSPPPPAPAPPNDTSQDKEHRITQALEEFRSGASSIRHLSTKYSVPRSTLRDRIKRAHISNTNASGEERRLTILKSRSRSIMDRQTRDLKQRERDALIQQALDYYHAAAADCTGDAKQGIRALSAKFGIPRSTLRGRLQGSRSSRSAARAQKGQKLSLAEEDTLVRWVKALCYSGEEVTASRIRNMANMLQQYRPTGSSTSRKTVDPVAEKKNQVCLGWVRGFLGRHPTLLDANGYILNVADVNDFTQQAFRDWFQLVCDTVTQRHIPPENIFIAGASSFFVSHLVIDNQRQLSPADLAPPYLLPSRPQAGPFVSLECFSCSCNSLPPFLVLPHGSQLHVPPPLADQWSVNHSASLFLQDVSLDAPDSAVQHIRVEKRLMLQWLTQWFDPASRAQANPAYPRILIGDTDWPGEDPAFARFCSTNGIDFLGVPIGKFHELLPYSAGVFSKMKRNLCTKIDVAMRATTDAADADAAMLPSDTLFQCFHEARKQTLTPATLSKALRQSGLWPLDSNLVINRIWSATDSDAKGADAASVPYGAALASALETNAPATTGPTESSTATTAETGAPHPASGDIYLQSILNSDDDEDDEESSSGDGGSPRSRAPQGYPAAATAHATNGSPQAAAAAPAPSQPISILNIINPSSPETSTSEYRPHARTSTLHTLLHDDNGAGSAAGLPHGLQNILAAQTGAPTSASTGPLPPLPVALAHAPAVSAVPANPPGTGPAHYTGTGNRGGISHLLLNGPTPAPAPTPLVLPSLLDLNLISPATASQTYNR